jgi:hypothetical protein
MKTSLGPKRIAINAKGDSQSSFNVLTGQLLNAKKILTEPGLQVSRLSDGSILELYGSGSAYPDYLFKKNNIVLSFNVNDLEEAVKDLKLSGARQLGTIENLTDGYSHCHMQLKDGTVIGIFQERLASSLAFFNLPAD